LKSDGTCEDCEDYFHPDEEGRNCVQCDLTGSTREIWTITGQCFTCPSKTYPGPEKKECISDDPCEDNAFLKDDGTCHTCDDYKLPNPAAMTCDTVECDENSKLLPNGQCETCPEGKHADETGRNCVARPVPPLLPCPPG
jgi:hypothetical protein